MDNTNSGNTKKFDHREYLKHENFVEYDGPISDLKDALISDLPVNMIIAILFIRFVIIIRSEDTIGILFIANGSTDLHTKNMDFVFPYSIQLESLRKREREIGDIKIENNECDDLGFRIEFTALTRCHNLLEAIEAGEKIQQEIDKILENAEFDFISSIKDFPHKLYPTEYYLELLNQE